MSEKFDIYAEITNRIIAEMEKGVIPWQKPWTGVVDGPIKHASGKPYSLLNQMLLGEPGEYLSFLECKKAGGSVKKGAKSRIVVFYKSIGHVAQDEDGNIIVDDDGNMRVKYVPYLRYSNVFHIDDCEGVKPKWDKPLQPHDVQADEAAENAMRDYLTRSGVRLHNEKGNRAYYSPMMDSITLPLREQFGSAAEYYSTAFHEMTHSTGHPKRLARYSLCDPDNHFGSESYSREELVAEIGAAAVLHSLGIETDGSFRNSAAYVQGWLSALKNDKRLIVSAAAKADKAVRLILNMADESADAKGADAQ